MKKVVNNKVVYQDFLEYISEEKFDLVIGNPPYKTINKKQVKDLESFKCLKDRFNLFILFIEKSLTLLEDEGILCFILPNSLEEI